MDWERKLEECQKKVKRLEVIERDIQLEKRNRDYRALDRKYRELFCENKQAVERLRVLERKKRIEEEERRDKKRREREEREIRERARIEKEEREHIWSEIASRRSESQECSDFMRYSRYSDIIGSTTEINIFFHLC